MNRTNLQNVWLVIGSIIFAFVLLEASYRSYLWLRYDEPMLQLKDKAFEAPRVRAAPQYLGHAFLNYIPNPLHPGITKDWFRVTPDVPNPKISVVALGGSSTFGVSVAAEFSYPSQVQHYLKEKGLDAKVYNAGVPGWKLAHHMARYVFQLRHRKPPFDLAVLYVGFNDMPYILSSDDSEV